MFWSPEKWDGPLSLHEMMEEDDFKKLNEMIAASLRFIKYSNDKEALQEMLNHDKIYTEFERKSAELINDITDYGMEFEEGKELVDVCKAAEDMRKDVAINIAKSFLTLGKNTIEEISVATNLPLDEVKSLAASMTK